MIFVSPELILLYLFIWLYWFSIFSILYSYCFETFFWTILLFSFFIFSSWLSSPNWFFISSSFSLFNLSIVFPFSSFILFSFIIIFFLISLLFCWNTFSIFFLSTSSSSFLFGFVLFIFFENLSLLSELIWNIFSPFLSYSFFSVSSKCLMSWLLILFIFTLNWNMLFLFIWFWFFFLFHMNH